MTCANPARMSGCRLRPFVPEEAYLALVDLQPTFLDRLEPARREAYLARTYGFADMLHAQGVSVIAVGLQAKSTPCYFPPATQEKDPARNQARTAMVQELFGPYACHVRPYQAVYRKSVNNLYDERPFWDAYTRKGEKLGLLAGLNTGACIGFSLYGAFLGYFDCLVVTDLLAQATLKNPEGANGGNPQWHHDILYGAVPQALSLRVGFSSTLALTSALRQGVLPCPAPPRALHGPYQPRKMWG